MVAIQCQWEGNTNTETQQARCRLVMILRHSDYIRGWPAAQIQSHNYACQYVPLVPLIEIQKQRNTIGTLIQISKCWYLTHNNFEENEKLASPPLSHLYSNLISTESGILSQYCKCHQQDFDQILTFFKRDCDDNRKFLWLNTNFYKCDDNTCFCERNTSSWWLTNRLQ